MRISFGRAQELLIERDISSPVERYNTENSSGYVLAEDVEVREDLPPFDNSAMDGYAVREEDLQSASEEEPVVLPVVDEVAAGDTDTEAKMLKTGEAMRIFTGAPVPENADMVVIQEHVERVGEQIHIDRVPTKGNIRFRGEELTEGEILMEKGTVLSPAAIGSLLGQGVLEISVFSRPEVGVVATGEELIDYHELPDPGQIRDTNRPMLRVALEQMDVEVETARVGDRPERIKEKISAYLEEKDVLMITGGMSVGDHDYVRDVLAELGVEKVFWKVNQKPGKPIYYGNRDDVDVLGFPGNPVSNLVCFYLYGVPLLRKRMGYPKEDLTLLQGVTRLETPVKKREKRVEFVRTRTRLESEEYRSKRLEHQGSHMLSGLVRANSLVKIPEGTGTTEGELLPIYFLP